MYSYGFVLDGHFYPGANHIFVANGAKICGIYAGVYVVA